MPKASVTDRAVQDGRLLNGRATRQRILDAAIVCLAREGYAGASTVRIAELAGVSRGAQLHHFQTRQDLVAAAVEHLASRRSAELAQRVDDLPVGPNRVGAALDLVWSAFSDDLFKATLALWTAADADAELRACVDAAELRLARQIRDVFALMLGAEIAGRSGFAARVQFAVEAMWGLAVLDNFHADAKARARRWAFSRRQLIAMFADSTGTHK
jgi:AcrR family transcriptional regulator